MKRFAKLGAVCLLAALGSGCAKSMVTIVPTENLCRDWTVYQPRKGDKLTDESAEQLLESNEARVVWGCERTANTIAS